MSLNHYFAKKKKPENPVQKVQKEQNFVKSLAKLYDPAHTLSHTYFAITKTLNIQKYRPKIIFKCGKPAQYRITMLKFDCLYTKNALVYAY